MKHKWVTGSLIVAIASSSIMWAIAFASGKMLEAIMFGIMAIIYIIAAIDTEMEK